MARVSGCGAAIAAGLFVLAGVCAVGCGTLGSPAAVSAAGVNGRKKATEDTSVALERGAGLRNRANTKNSARWSATTTRKTAARIPSCPRGDHRRFVQTGHRELQFPPRYVS